MSKYLKISLLILALVIMAGILAIRLLPTAVQALPGQVRGRLPEEFLRAVTTPLPTALPAPAATPANLETFIAALDPPPTKPAPAEPVEAGSPAIEAAEAEPAGAEPVETQSTAANPSSSAPAAAPPTAMDPPPAEPAETPLATRTLPLATRTSPLATRTLPLATQLTGLQIVPQKLNNCGPATLSINLNFYGLEQTQFDVAGVVKPRYDDRNVLPEELVDYTNQYTSLRASLYRGGDLELLKRLIAAGFPVVIEKGYEPDEWQGWMGHYLTLYGYDEQAGEFMTMDTYLGPWDSSGRSVSYAEIAAGRQHFNNTFYVVYEPDQEQTLHEITGPILNEEQAMWQQALERAKESISVEPQNAFAWFNLGSSLTRLGQLTADPQLFNAATTAFDQARLLGLPPRMLWYQFEPYQAYLASGRIEDVLTLTTAVLENTAGRDVEETYLYRGHARLALGETAAAQADYRRALELRPGFPEAAAALSQLEND